MSERPSIEVAVIMRRERIDNRWQPWRWVLEDVVPQESTFGTEPRLLLKSDARSAGCIPVLRSSCSATTRKATT